MPVNGESYTTIIPKHRPQAMLLAHPEEVQGIPRVAVQKVWHMKHVQRNLKLVANTYRVWNCLGYTRAEVQPAERPDDDAAVEW